MKYVLMQGPNNGYLFVVRAASDKHFAMMDSGFEELASGSFIEMHDKMKVMETIEFRDLIWILKKNVCFHVTAQELEERLEKDRNYMDDKEFINKY